jgi:hypothetical protein
MRCRFCATEIADKALICYRCGKPTTDARVAPPPVHRGPSTPLLASALAVVAGVAVALPSVLDPSLLTEGWTALGVVGAGIIGWWIRGRRRP